MEFDLNRLRNARHIVALTGAGISAESGIPTFRDKLTGLWERFDAAELATADAFRRDPALVWGWYEWRRARIWQAKPNAAHLAIAALARYVPQLTVVTQNVDDLHERAGTKEVLHIHGRLNAARCFACNRPHPLPADIDPEPEEGRLIEPPRCSHCGGRIRPGVVWFNEQLPLDIWKAAQKATSDCDVLLAIGTSGIVYPAASLPGRALKHGATVLHVNPVAPEFLNTNEFAVRGNATKALPELISRAFNFPR